MCSCGLVFKPRGLAWASDLGGDRCERSFGLRTPLDQSCFPAEKPASTLLAAQALPLCRCWNAASGPGAR